MPLRPGCAGTRPVNFPVNLTPALRSGICCTMGAPGAAMGAAASCAPPAMRKGRHLIMETTPNTNTTMLAAVCRVCPCMLCVCDLENGREVLVHYDRACCFHVGDRVCIHYNGAMTQSIPPLISASCVECASCC